MIATQSGHGWYVASLTKTGVCYRREGMVWGNSPEHAHQVFERLWPGYTIEDIRLHHQQQE